MGAIAMNMAPAWAILFVDARLPVTLSVAACALFTSKAGVARSSIPSRVTSDISFHLHGSCCAGRDYRRVLGPTWSATSGRETKLRPDIRRQGLQSDVADLAGTAALWPWSAHASLSLAPNSCHGTMQHSSAATCCAQTSPCTPCPAVQEHVKTMVMCQDYDFLESLKVTQTDFQSTESKEAHGGAKRRQWTAWAAELNNMDVLMEDRKH